MSESINKIGVKYSRPWGYYKTIEYGKNFQVKIIEVFPTGCLSLQKHLYRSEHWIIVQGEATVTIDQKTKIYKSDQHIYIPKTSQHRIINKTNNNIMLVEIQFGNYLGEDDIIRIEDIYGR